MPKSQVIDPVELRKRGPLEFQPIDFDCCNITVADEFSSSRYTKRQLQAIYSNMAKSQTFEEMPPASWPNTRSSLGYPANENNCGGDDLLAPGRPDYNEVTG